MILPPTSKISHNHKVNNITVTNFSFKTIFGMQHDILTEKFDENDCGKMHKLADSLQSKK